MTVSSTTTKNSRNGNGSLVEFSYTFKILDEDDIAVILRDDATGNETTQNISTHYSVSGVGNAGGGAVTFVTAPPTGTTVVLLRATPLTQVTDYTPNDPFPAESHEDALDKLTFITQELSEEVGRSLKLSQTNEIATAEFTAGAAVRANKVLGFDSAGDLTVLQEIGIYKGTDATVTTAAYDPRDFVKSTTAAELNNVYIALQASPLGTSLTNTTYWALVVDAVSAATSATNAANSATAAATEADDVDKIVNTPESTQYTLSNGFQGFSSLHYFNATLLQANNSVTQAGLAQDAKADAIIAQEAAEDAQEAAEAALDLFDDAMLGAKASDPTLDNDGNALEDGALYFDTTNDVMKVYNLATTSWLQLTPTVSNQVNINTVAGQISPTNNIATVAGIDSEIETVAGINTTHLSNVSGLATEIGLLGTADAVADMNTLGTAAIVTDMDLLADRATDIGLLADIEDGTTATNAIQTVAANLSGITAFADVYSSGPNDPTTNLNEGDLFFNTTSDTLKVYTGSAWEQGVTAGSGFLPLSGGQLTGNLTFSATQTVDGRDLSVDGAKLDGIEASADVTDTANVTAAGAAMLTGATFTGAVTATSFSGDGSSLTNLPAAGIANVVDDTTPQLGGTLDVNSNDIDFGQSNKALFGGVGGDLEIYHNGTNAYIDNNDGILYIRNNVDGDDGSDIYIQAKSGENGIIVQDDGEVQLYYNGVEKLNTSNTGITVAGTVAATSYTGDGSSLTGISAGATGGGSDQIFYENGQTVTTNYTITNGKNAMSAGPITINTGVTVTVGTGETWTVV